MKRHLTVLSFALLLCARALPAANNPAAVWEGTLSTPNGEMKISVNLHQDGGKWAAELDVPAQSISGIPLSNVTVDGAKVSFTMPGVGTPGFEGKLSEDGKTISGQIAHGDATSPLDLKWVSEAKAVAKAPANSGDVQVLEGVWEGTLDANGNQLHLRFNFTKSAGGDITGTVDSIDQGANGLPIETIARTSDTIKLELKTIGGSFEGTLSKDAATLKGTWTQGGGNLPLTIERKKKA